MTTDTDTDTDIAFLEEQHRGAGAVLASGSAALAALPTWLTPVVSLARSVAVTDLTRWPTPPEGGRSSSVLILFGDGSQGRDVLLIERAHDMRSHSGQPAFPGGALDPGDSGIVAAALREAVEETGLDAGGVRPFAVLPDLFVPPSGFVVSPVLAWWAKESDVSVVDTREVASVHRVPWSTLIDPVNRVKVRHPSGYIGSGFLVGDLVVWGFTGGLLDRVIALAGWERPWDRSVIVDVDERIELFDEGPSA